MPFKKTFEKSLNRNMMQQDAGSSSHSHPSDLDDTDIKTPYIHEREHDDKDEAEYHPDSKKDAPPPRFSTIYGPTTTNTSPPMPDLPARRDPYTTHSTLPPGRSGIWMPWSLFILLALMLFLESTVLFTYTIIGLYNNTPSRVFAWAGVGDAYSPPEVKQQQQPAVNFAPNIVIPQPQPLAPSPLATPLTITMSELITTISTTTASFTTTATATSFSTSTVTATVTSMPQDLIDEMISRFFASSASSPSTTDSMGSIVSDLASLLKPSSFTTSAGAETGLAVTETATVPPSTAPSTSTAVVVVTVNPSGQTISASDTKSTALPSIVAKDTTSPSETQADPSSSVLLTSKEEASAPSTTLSTAKAVTSASTTKPAPSASSSTDATASQGFCFGAGGATELICEPGRK